MRQGQPSRRRWLGICLILPALLAIYGMGPAAPAKLLVSKPQGGSRNDTGRFKDPRLILGSHLVDWWPCWDSSRMSQSAEATAPVTGDDQPCNRLTSVNGHVLTSAADANGPRFRTNLLGGRGGLKFAGGPEGLIGNVSQSFQHGVTVILLCRVTDPLTPGGVVCASPSEGVPSYATPDGWYTGIDYGGSIRLARDEWATSGFRDSAFVQSPVDTAPAMFVMTLNSKVEGPVYIEAVATNPGIATIQHNGGFTDAHDTDNYSDQSPIDVGVFSIGSRTDVRQSPAIEVFDVFVCDGPVPPRVLQQFTDEYVKPFYGNAFAEMEQFPTRFGKNRPLSGPGLHVDCGLLPIQDLQAMGIKWVRQSAEAPYMSEAAIDALIDHYMPHGIKICWILSIDPVVGGAFTDPHERAKLICNRYVAKGYPKPPLELGNEVIQLHIFPNTQSFATEEQARDAYIKVLNSFRTNMLGYDYFLIAANDAAPFVLRLAKQMQAQGIRQPDIWGHHNYTLFDTAPGTSDAMEATYSVDVVNTEGNARPATVSKPEAVAWFQRLYENMGERPWCYYRGGGPYNPDTFAYSWYSHTEQNYNGIPGLHRYSTRTATLMETATAIGAILPP